MGRQPGNQSPSTMTQQPIHFYLVDIYYVCYYPESDEFRQQVASIVNYLRQSGYNVVMDVMVSEEISSQGPTRWAERQIRKARKVLVFLSPGLVNLAQDEMTDTVMTQVFAYFRLTRQTGRQGMIVAEAWDRGSINGRCFGK